MYLNLVFFNIFFLFFQSFTLSFHLVLARALQFLPQDRVCEFAKLTPVQLLEETEKAVGDPQLPIQHRALVDKSRELKTIEMVRCKSIILPEIILLILGGS